jgi:hypothetical protein
VGMVWVGGWVGAELGGGGEALPARVNGPGLPYHAVGSGNRSSGGGRAAARGPCRSKLLTGVRAGSERMAPAKTHTHTAPITTPVILAQE